MVFSPVFISHHPCFCRASLPLPKLSAPCFSPLDFPSLSLTLNLQPEVRRLSRPEIPTRSGLSTFNRFSFLSPSSPHLCALYVFCGENSSSFPSSLIPHHSPLTTNSFVIRTSMTPFPQPLYNPHLQTPLGSAGNKGLITPLESALTKISPVTSLESALTKTGGWGYLPNLWHSHSWLCSSTGHGPRAAPRSTYNVPSTSGEHTMRYRRFGRTGWNVSEIGYGMWGMGGWTGSDDAESLDALQRAVDLGCNFFDTAWAYGEGHSEQLLGKILRANKNNSAVGGPDKKLYVATKVPPKNRRWPAR